jgi:hypothetical protein
MLDSTMNELDVKDHNEIEHAIIKKRILYALKTAVCKQKILKTVLKFLAGLLIKTNVLSA